MAQKDLLKAGDNFKLYELARKPIENMYGYISGFNIEPYENESLTFEADNKGKSVKAYYFEADSNGGTAYVEDYNGAWNTLATINLTNTGLGFVAYSGSVTPTSGATKSRIRFEGDNYYNTVNRALFPYSFESGKVPVYRPYVPITLPTDVKHIEKVIIEYPERAYANDPVYKIEWDGAVQTLYLSYYYEGSVRVQYRPVTTAPTAFTDLIQIDDVTAIAISYYLAMNFVATEQNQSLTSLFRSEYERLKAQAMQKQPLGFTDIVNYYGTF